MAVHVEKRRGKTALIVDIRFTHPDGTPGRYRKLAEVQTKAAAKAEDQRRLVALATTGSPEGDLPVANRTSPAVAPVESPIVRVIPAELQPARPPAPSKLPTFAKTVEQYLAIFAPSRLKPSTIRGYRAVLEGTGPLARHFGHLRLDEITPVKILDLDAQMVRGGAKASTRRNVMAVLRSVLCKFAVEAGLLPEPPKLPKLPKVGRTILRVLKTEQVDAVLATLKPRHRRAVMLAAYAGLRAGEVRGLRWRDVDLQADHLVVRESICHGQVATPKSGHERMIPLDPRLRANLEQTKTPTPGALVSPSPSGEPWSEFALRNAFKRACNRAKVGSWRFHDLRHYFVTTLFRGGAPAPAVQALAGHAELTTTQRYAHVTTPDLQVAMGRFTQASSGLRCPKTDLGQQVGQHLGSRFQMACRTGRPRLRSAEVFATEPP